MPEFLSDEWVAALAGAAADLVVDDAGARLTVQHVVDGRPTHWMSVAGGRARAGAGSAGDADVTLHLDRATAAALSRGQLTAQQAIIEGRLRVRGDVGSLVRHGEALAGLDAAMAGLRDATRY